MIRIIFISIIVSLFFFGCNTTDKVEAEIAKIDVNVKVSRFDREFASAKVGDFLKLKKTYPYLFPVQYSDSIWAAKMQDSIQVELFSEVGNFFPDFMDEKQDLEALFQHIKYYFPQFNVPHVVTLTNDVEYNYRVILEDSLLLIGLDNYLGPKHRFYTDIHNYIAAGLDKKYMVSDITEDFARKVVPRLRDRTFLSDLVYFGKILFLKDKLMPSASDAIKMRYSQEQLDWAINREELIWRNFIEQEHLYSTDKDLQLRFIEPAPFSKFGLVLDNESPGRLGQYIGWQIVRSFMSKNEITVQQLLKLPAEEIFKKSSYKPRK